MFSWQVVTRRQLFSAGAAVSLAAGAISAADSPQTTSSDERSLDGSWLFRLDADANGESGGWAASTHPVAGWREVQVPHTWQVEPENTDYRGYVWYRRSFDVPQSWSDSAVRIEFEAVFHTAVVWINGRPAGEHVGKGYTAFTLDIGQLLHYGALNMLAVRVDNTFSEAMLPRGRSSDWAHDGGIYRPVRLLITPKVFLERIEVDAAPTSPGRQRRSAAKRSYGYVRGRVARDTRLPGER